MALYGAETWMLQAVDQKHLESIKMWCWPRRGGLVWNFMECIASVFRSEETSIVLICVFVVHLTMHLIQGDAG